MKLCQPETLGILHHHHCSIRHIHSYLNYSSRYQDLNFPCGKSLHDHILLFRFHLSMKRSNLYIRRKNIAKLQGIIQHIFPIHPFALLHHWTDHINLPSLTDLLLHKGISLRPVRSIHHTIFNGKSLRRKFINYRNIQIPVYNDRQRPRNRCSTHHQHIRRVSHSSQCFPLFHTKTMLLIRDHKTQITVHNLLLDQRMCSDHQIRLFRCD